MSRVINGLLPLGITHTIVVLKGDAIIRDCIDPKVSIHCLHAGAKDIDVPWRLHRLLQSEKPALIHARNLGAWPEIAVARLLTRPAVPLVFSFHGLAEARPVSRKWRLLSRCLARWTSRVFSVSEASKQFLVDHIGLRAAAIDVIPNGVDTQRFYPRQPRLTHEVLRIGTVGSLLPVKNQALLLRACGALLAQGTRLRLEIAGEGPLRAELQAHCLRLGIADNVVFLGEVADVPGFLNSLDVFVLPSDSEAHPNALSEAMACGLACVATAVGGVPEIVDQGRAARLVPRGDQEALARVLGDLLADPDTRQRLGLAARQFASHHHSMDTMLQRYRALYTELACRGRHEAQAAR